MNCVGVIMQRAFLKLHTKLNCSCVIDRAFVASRRTKLKIYKLEKAHLWKERAIKISYLKYNLQKDRLAFENSIKNYFY